MLKKERTNELNELQEHILNSIKIYLNNKNYTYNSYLILHSFSDEFLLKLYLYPKHESKKMSLIATIYLSKEKELIKVKNMLTQEFIKIENNSFEHMTNILGKLIEEYNYRMRIVYFQNLT